VFVSPNGAEQEVSVDVGKSVMEAAVANDIPQIEAECGGAMACATCHVYVDSDWMDKIDERTEFEEDMLEVAEHEVKPQSRLSCQIKMTDALHGIRIGLTG